MAKVKFYRLSAPIGEVPFTRNPNYGGDDAFEFVQPFARDDDGGVILYSKGKKPDEVSLLLNSSPDVDYRELRNFMENVVEGAVYTFTYLNADGDLYTARIKPGQRFNWPQRSYRRRSVMVTLEIVTDRREFHQLDNSGDIMPRDILTGVTDDFFELDGNGDIMPKETITGTSEFFELDGNGDITMKETF